MLISPKKSPNSAPFPVSKSMNQKWRGTLGYGSMLAVDLGYARGSKREQNLEP